MRNMAYTVTVKNIEPIEGKDRIAYATFTENSYGTIVPKTYKVGDVVVYFEVDSILPIEPRFEFLRKRCFNERVQGFLVKPMKMSGFYSFGLTMTFDELGIKSVPANTDLTDVLKVRKDEPYADRSPKENKNKLYSLCMKYRPLRYFAKFFVKSKENVPFPVEYISKSDEENIYNHPDWFEKFHDDDSYITVKMEGQSVTILFQRDRGLFGGKTFRVYGRNTLATKEATDYLNSFKNALAILNKTYKTEFAIQGEFCSPEVQCGIYKNGTHFYVYRIRDTKKQKDVDFPTMLLMCEKVGFEFVPVIDKTLKDFKTLDELLDFVEHIYFMEGSPEPFYILKSSKVKSARHEEGIVIRNKDQSWSFKVKSKEYQLEF